MKHIESGPTIKLTHGELREQYLDSRKAADE